MLERLSKISGLAVISIGLLTVAGWLVDSRMMTAWIADSLPMAPNTGIAFTLLGLALWSLSSKAVPTPVIPRIFSLLPLTLVLPRIVEYLFRVDLGVDGWLIQAPAGIRTGTEIGRMGFFTAFCFVLASLALLTSTLPMPRRFIESIAGVSSVALIGIGLLFSFGYLFTSPLFSAVTTIPLAFNTAIAFLILGLGTILALLSDRVAGQFPSAFDAKLRRLHRFIVTGFGLAFAAVLVISIISYENTTQLVESTRLVAHTYRVLAEAEGIISTMKGIESASRGYALSADTSFLRTYREGTAAIWDQFRILRQLTMDNPKQQERLERLEKILQSKVDFSRTVVELIQQNNLRQGQELIRGGRGRVEMDSIKALLHRFEADERQLLEMRMQDRESNIQKTIVTFTLLSVFVMILLGIFYVVIERSLVDRQKSEEGLKSAAREIEDLYNNAPCGYHSLDHEGRFVRINDTELAWLGYTQNEVLGKMRFTDLLTSSSFATFQENFPKFREQGHIEGLEFEVRRKDGSTFWVMLSATAVVDESGRYLRSRSTMFDISERKRAEATIRRLAAIVDSTNDAVIGKSLDGIVTSWNRGAVALFGYPTEEMIGKSITTVFPPEHVDQIKTTLDRIGSGAHISHYETRCLRKDGRILEVSVTISPIRDAAGTIVGVSTIARDMTSLKESQRKLEALNKELEQKTSELEFVNKELEAFSYSVSHDLRAPLRHINGFVDLLRKQAEPHLDEISRRHLEIITKSATHMGQLIDDLLVFSRMSRKDLVKGEVDLNTLVKEVVKLLEMETKDRSIEWNIGTLPTVRGDLAMLRMVFVNLLSNAVKYTRTRPHAVIEIGSRIEETGERVVWVKDNGVGFDMNYVHKLFGVFQRLHLADEFEGTGIGLATVQRIIQRHGGRVWAEGTIDQGATLYCAFPSQEKESP